MKKLESIKIKYKIQLVGLLVIADGPVSSVRAEVHGLVWFGFFMGSSPTERSSK